MNKRIFSKPFFISLFLITFGITILNAQTNLELANKYYNEDDYSKSIDYFKKAIFEDNQYDGTIFYRYAYSMEQNKLPANEYSSFYSASAYLFETTNTTDSKYYSYAIAKEEKLGLSHKKFSNKTIDDILAGKNIHNQDFIHSTIDFVDRTFANAAERMTKEWGIIYCIIVIVIYIIGRCFSKKTECVILSSYKEILLLFAPFSIVILLYINAILSVKLNTEIMYFIVIVLFFISFVSAIIFSVNENLGTKHKVLYITISLITKLAMFIIAPIVLLLSTAAMKNYTEDKRFKDGTKNNQKSKNIAIAISVIVGLVFSLIKKPKRTSDADIADW